MRHVDATEARRTFSRLYNEVAYRGDRIIIDHHGKGLVALVPAAEAETLADSTPQRPTPAQLADCLHTLRSHRDSLEASGVRHIAIFGSVARHSAVANSDVDVLVDLDRETGVDLFAFAALRDRIAQLCGREVDLVSKGALHPERDQHILNEAAWAF